MPFFKIVNIAVGIFHKSVIVVSVSLSLSGQCVTAPKGATQ